MPEVTLKLPSWIADRLGVKSSGWLTLQKDVAEGSTVSDFLMGMVSDYPGFREVVCDPGTGLLTQQVSMVLNNRLLTFEEVTHTKLTKGDTITLTPIYVGG
jgi:hypothetical protein